MSGKLRLGVSACLLGRKVRYDGQDRRDDFVADVLSPFVDWVPVCPELELGLGVPREPIRLVGRPAAPRLVAERSGADLTAAMAAYARARVAELARLDLDGYVTKKDSPSCGMERVRVHPARGGPPRRAGRGAFVAVLLDALPLLPVEEEGRLRDPALRETFLELVFAHVRWKRAVAGGLTRAGLARFHAAHELALLAHSPAAYRRLDRLVAGGRGRPLRKTADAYARGLMDALRVPAARGGHARVLDHLLRHLRPVLEPGDLEELQGVIRDDRRSRVPLVVPLTLVRHHVRRAGIAHLAGQVYLDPDPRELLLRNRA